jgi:hypothetical protein
MREVPLLPFTYPWLALQVIFPPSPFLMATSRVPPPLALLVVLFKLNRYRGELMPLKDDEFDIGGSGIDTQYERDYINYRPKIEYTPPSGNSGQGLSADTANQSQSALTTDSISGSSAIDVWQTVVDTVDSVNQLVDTLSQKLQDVSVPIPASLQTIVQQAAQELGIQGITDSIPFTVYKETFSNPTTPPVTIIQDTFEDYMADVDGNLNGEIFTDAIEMQNDWVDMLDFVKRGLFAQVVPLDQTPTEFTTDDSNLDGIKAAEDQLDATYAQLLMILQVNQQIFDEAAATSYGSQDYYDALAQLNDVKRQIENLENKLFTKAETVDLIDRKASDTTDTVNLLTNTVDFDPYDGDKYQLLYGLLKQFPTRDAAITGLKKMMALLKLSIDGKITDTKSMRQTLRGMAGSANKRKINNNLVNGIHVRNEVSSDVYDIMNNLDGIPNVSTFDTVAGHIVDGVKQAEKIYNQQAGDFYKMNVMDSVTRMNKIASVVDKDAARSTYQLLNKVVNYTQNVNTTWPDEASLSTWLNDFMSHNNIS